MSDDARKQNYWVLKAMGFTNTETLLYCQEHRRITLTWEGEPFCCLKTALEQRVEDVVEKLHSAERHYIRLQQTNGKLLREKQALEQRVAEGDRLLLAAALKYTELEAKLSKMEEALLQIRDDSLAWEESNHIAEEALAGGKEA